jgi:ABC-type transporter Mla subunit MlaD
MPTQPVVVQPTVERHRSLWPLTFALAAIMVVLIVVLWVVVQRATTL